VQAVVLPTEMGTQTNISSLAPDTPPTVALSNKERYRGCQENEGVAVAVGVLVGVRVTVLVAVGVLVGVCVAVGGGVNVAVLVAVSVAVSVDVGMGSGVNVGSGVVRMFCGSQF
jgi:hypothetical protein